MKAAPHSAISFQFKRFMKLSPSVGGMKLSPSVGGMK
jgi:hypothetical protein